jgi:cytochrome P450
MPDTTSPVPGHVPAELVYDYDFIFDEALNANPIKRLRTLHKVAPPLFYTPHYGGHWVVTNKQIFQDITLNHENFSAANLMLPPGETEARLIPASFDPPQHTAYRMPLNKYFSPTRVMQYQDLIRTTAVQLIEAVANQPECDFFSDIAEPFPPKVLFHILGIPLDRLREFRNLANDFMSSPEAAVRAKAYGDISNIIQVVVEQRIAEPKDDLLSVLVSLDFGGRKLTMDEVINYAVLLFLGGLDTVVNGMSFIVEYLATHLDLQDELRADPALLPDAIEELLRMHAIATPLRTATRDMDFHGAPIRKGDQMMLLTTAINYDPEAYSDAETYNPKRSEHHVTFNMGAHRCLGASLGRLELRIFLQEWLARVKRFRINPAKPAKYAGGFSISVVSLPLLLGE